ncbi:MAG TPA: hypothetical protein VN843_07150, partial [Anaerolineales bacterium]|nr:hypothetical protein [Anaerolineales bacterium]
MRKTIHAALTLMLGAALLQTTVVVGYANTSSSLPHKVAHNHEHLTIISKSAAVTSSAVAVPEAPKATKEAARLRPDGSHRKKAPTSHNHAAAPTFVFGCMDDCMRGLIPDELLVACAVLCGGGVAPACAACLGWYTGVAIGCAID